jgi:thiol:disulfide interchange protein DsbC
MNAHPHAQPCVRPLLRLSVLAALLLSALSPVMAQEAVLRKALAERIPNLPKIDEVLPTPIHGLYEVRIGTDIYYADEKGDHIIQGSMIDTRTRTNLTDARIEKLTAVDFATLPFKDAVVYKQGNGSRKLAVFVDPNCGYCKRFERDLVTLKDVTIYTFIYPILGSDSTAKSRDIWCSANASKTWRAWMIDGVAPTKVMGKCDTAAIERNVDFGRKYRVQGTPAVFFEDGTRKPGAMSAAEVEKLLVAARKG